jgi:hypothetical protein
MGNLKGGNITTENSMVGNAKEIIGWLEIKWREIKR